jgi:hypothetical protein
LRKKHVPFGEPQPIPSIVEISFSVSVEPTVFFNASATPQAAMKPPAGLYCNGGVCRLCAEVLVSVMWGPARARLPGSLASIELTRAVNYWRCTPPGRIFSRQNHWYDAGKNTLHCLIGIEAGMATNYVGRELLALSVTT